MLDRSKWHPCTRPEKAGEYYRLPDGWKPSGRCNGWKWRRIGPLCQEGRIDHWYRTRGERRAKKPDLPNDVSLAMFNSCSKYKPSGPGWWICSE